MESESFPGCCGIDVIYGFGACSDSPEDPAKIEQLIKELHFIRDADRGYAMLTLNTQQEKAGLGKMVKKAGFRLLERFSNPNSGNMVYLYGRKTTRLPKKMKKSIMEESAPVQERGPQDFAQSPLVPRTYAYQLHIPAQQAGTESARGVTTARGE